jgi:hypothetical protein
LGLGRYQFDRIWKECVDTGYIKTNKWKTKDGKDAGITAIRDAIGESVPPRILEIIISHLENIKSDKIKTSKSFQEKLFS